MAETRVCKCGFGRRAAAAGYGRMLLASVMAVTAIAAARDIFPARYEFGVAATLCTLLALSVVADFTALWDSGRLEQCTGRPHRLATGAWPWLFPLIVFMAVPALFAANRPALAIVVESYVLARVAVGGIVAAGAMGLHADAEGAVLDPDAVRRFLEAGLRYAAFGLVALLSATTWLATGTAPTWIENTILAALWIIVSALLFGEAGLIWRDMVGDYLPAERDNAGSSFTKEPRPGLEDLPLISPGRAGWWLGNTGMILLIYELSLAGQTALAALWVLQVLMAWALNTERQLRVPEDRRGEIGQPYLALHAAVRDIARALHLAVATPVRAVRHVLGRKR